MLRHLARVTGLVIAAGLLITLAASRASAQTPPASTTASLVTTVSNVAFYSDELINLHHTLYAAAWARRSAAAGSADRSLAGPLPAPLEAPFTSEERSAWDAAIAFYDTKLASRDLLFGEGMEQMSAALIAGDLPAADAVLGGLASTLT